MSQTFAVSKASFSITYTFWHTVAILGLFVILLINYRQLLLDNSSFSMMITHLRWQHINNLSLMLDLGMFLTAIIVLHLTLLLGANSYFYPTSLLVFFRGTMLAEPLLLICLSLVLIAVFLAGLYLQCGRVISISCTILMVAALLGNKMYPSFIRTTPLEQPNIIIIGIDGLRPDHLTYGGANSGQTPFRSGAVAIGSV
ncbi:MAG: hypothetical protein HRU22_12775 [Gammaproteobacteria bacterium]|nr:hypothetical protein [Gammaproteobacteria bacterium]